MDNSNKYAVIVAGGKGSRMGAAVPKQFLHLQGKPLLCHPILAFANAIPGINIIVVVPEDQVDSAEIVIRSYLDDIEVTVLAGGGTRYHSVRNGLQKIPDDGGIIFVHDGARPLVSRDLILRCLEKAEEKGSAIPALTVTDSIRYMEDGITKPLNRDNLRIIQTPQTFKTGILLQAYKQAYLPSFTDEATAVEASGRKIYLVEGDKQNIKVTTPGDMILADALLIAKEKEESLESFLGNDI